MACVHKFVWDFEFDWVVDDVCEIQLVIDASDKHQPMRCDVLELVGNILGSHLPIGFTVPAPPGRRCHARPSNFVSQVHSDDSWIVFISLGHFS